MLERANCLYPSNSPYTGYKYGCRCLGCVVYVRNYTNRNAYKYREKSQAYHKKLYQQNKATIQRRGQLLKLQIFENYGGAQCVCCQENNFSFLCLDHVFNDGRQDRLARGAGEKFYRSLQKEGFPNKEKYQVLCFNCNSGKSVNGGVCPHKSQRNRELLGSTRGEQHV